MVAIYTVTTTSDTVDAGDGMLSLREALTAANATSAADTINFASGVQGRTIVLAGSQLTASRDVTIDGGSGVTIDADGKSRVLFLEGSGTDAKLSGLAITGGILTEFGSGGGGILAEVGTTLALDHVSVVANRVSGRYADGGGIQGAVVKLSNCEVIGNSTSGYLGFGGGVSGSHLVLSHTVVSHNRALDYYGAGGGIHGECILLEDSILYANTAGSAGGVFCNGGILTINRSSILDNTANAAGGILAPGAATITDSTISGNSSDDSGGGVFGGSIMLTNSTVSGNSARGDGVAGGGIIAFESVALVNSTVTGNSVTGGGAKSGGIALAQTTTEFSLANSIVAGNMADATNNDVNGPVTFSNGHNIFGSYVDGAVAGDLQNVRAGLLFAAIDPTTGGGQLADNGGPTQTIALRDARDNPALAAADPADSLAIDQRGEARPQPEDTAPDIGAFELNQTGGAINEIVGTPRGEFLSGTVGADLMRGLGGDDRLWGRSGDDRLFGGAGRDVLAGKAGVDEMTGGVGADRFLFRAAIQAPPGRPAYDTILDFSHGQHDRIDLRPIDADRSEPGNQAFAFIGEQLFTGPGQLRYEATAEGLLITGNTDRNLAADFAVLVHADLARLHATDFLL